ncbi:hypothetical protein HYN59_08700 [Flavobacterium album]|uniref:Porin n=1 Tax=Flavobacterium album TaxID=2175091 RepID=A0A2S1QXS9_9FLAO|nr:putative porin [Flavobacterium album]AWH85195.1 hypothetical protein HYN59_08700 [Flavobacterium album]
MQRIFLSIFLLMLPVLLFSQDKKKGKLNSSPKGNSASIQRDDSDKGTGQAKTAADTIATIDMYKIVTLERDTIIVDTSLTIKNEYQNNYLRKDNFGLLAFPNDGQTYNTLDYGLTKFNPFPGFGFTAKHFNYMEVEDINYYNVATPYTDLFYRSTQKQGQILDAFITVNTSENLNMFVGYRGIRSIGKYINSISSNGNLRIGGSYNTKDKRYFLKLHFTGQDLSNQENGGIINTDFFESGVDPYTQRERLDVYFKDATSMLKGNRFFADHTFRLNKSNPNSIVFHHRFTYENKFFEYTQPTKSTRFGAAYTTSINNKTRYNMMYNMVGAAYSNEKIGMVEFYVEDFNYNYFYRTIILNPNGSLGVPNAINDRVDTYGARYTYHKNKLKGSVLFSNSITKQSLANIDISARYTFDENNSVSARYQNMNKLPNQNYKLYQSDYKAYNWYNPNVKNEKINSFEFEAKTKWVDASVQYTILNDHLYFKNEFINTISTPANIDTLYVKPQQYGNTINYFSVKVGREFRVWKLALDNTVLYQKVDQRDNVINVPELVTRNTLYYSDYVFKKALYFQTGITFQYFTKYYGNDYNPLIGEFFVQDKKKFGDFPLMDFFINAKIKEFRMFLRAEHFNSGFTGYDYYSAPNTPYRDFTVRFGVIWDFFS